ncbi:MAG: hypothetical protein ACRD50_15095 [Candidatus Acidiferrales bacterium]
MNETCGERDLVSGPWACLVWCLPVALLIVGFYWQAGRVWLWVPALVVAGGACAVNARRCGRLHCYITGPLYLGAALYVILAAFGLLPLQAGKFLLIVFLVTVLAFAAELLFGRYLRRDSPPD